MESVLTNSGDGYGYGYGDGYGELIGQVGEYSVELIQSFVVVVIGCQAKTIAEWRKCWQSIASKHDIEITQAEVDTLIAIAEGESDG